MNKNQISLLVRFFNFLIDSCILAILVILIVNIVIKFSSLFSVYNPLINRIIGFIIYFFYYFIFEIIFFSTPGKLITKTKIVDNQNSKPTMLKVFVRTLCRFIPFEALTIFFNPNNQVLHDIISRTTVVKNN
jgi:uncharacterized RDD family membrane protein YckC